MSNLEVQVKNIAREHGATLVGIASKERLLNAPPSGNPEYLLPSTQSVISFAVTLNKETVRSFLSKKDWLSHCEERKQMTMTLYNISDRIVDFLKSKGFEAVTVDGNNVYRPEMGARDFTEMTEFIPDFSHRYGAVAAGIGRLGWSGNLMTTDYGAMVELGTVLTSAKMVPDPLLENNPCDRCKLCTTVCPVGMISKNKTVTVNIAGISEVIAEKKPNTCCWIGCTGYNGLALNGRWSNWSPYRLGKPLPRNKEDLDKLNIQLQKADPLTSLEDNSFSDYRKAMFNPEWFTNTVCGNCRSVCWHDRRDREENRRLIVESGTVALRLNGDHVVAKEDIIEVETPYIVRVAMLKKEFDQTTNSSELIGKINPRSPLDKAMISYLLRNRAHDFQNKVK